MAKKKNSKNYNKSFYKWHYNAQFEMDVEIC